MRCLAFITALHDLEMWDWVSLGYTPAGPEVWNGIRALDYLETRPEVDPKRLAITGISGGGAMTWYGAAIDERLQAGASVCATWTVEHHTKLDAIHENCDCIYFMNTFQADLPSVGALIAPRPFKMLSARRDRKLSGRSATKKRFSAHCRYTNSMARLTRWPNTITTRRMPTSPHFARKRMSG